MEGLLKEREAGKPFSIRILPRNKLECESLAEFIGRNWPWPKDQSGQLKRKVHKIKVQGIIELSVTSTDSMFHGKHTTGSITLLLNEIPEKR